VLLRQQFRIALSTVWDWPSCHRCSDCGAWSFLARWQHRVDQWMVGGRGNGQHAVHSHGQVRHVLHHIPAYTASQMHDAPLDCSQCDPTMKPSSSTQVGTPVNESAHAGGSKDVWGASSVSPRVDQAWTSYQTGSIPKGAALIGPTNLVPELYQRWPLIWSA
jgi:hypothetical protein